MTGRCPAGRPWTLADDRQLQELLNAGMEGYNRAENQAYDWSYPIEKELSESEGE